MSRDQWRVFALCCVAVVAAWTLNGCAAYDEWRCGGRMMDYRNGQCVGFGSGSTWQTLDPNVARELRQAGAR